MAVEIVDDRPPICPNDDTLLVPVNDEEIRCPECQYGRVVVTREDD